MKVLVISFMMVFFLGCASLTFQKMQLWESTINRYIYPINIEDSVITDLDFMDKYLDSISYVFIGESSHEVEEYFHIREILIKYLCDKKGFTVVAYEHNKGSCYIANLLNNRISYDSLYTYYYGEGNGKNIVPAGGLSLLKYYYANNIYTTGFDVLFSRYYFYNIVRKYLPDIPDTVLRLDSDYIYVNHSWSIRNVWKNIILDSNYFYYKNEYQSALHKEIINRNFWLSKMPNVNPNLRDSVMAENIMWIIRNECPNQKIIFLAHNGHIDKSEDNKANPMMHFIPDSIKAKSYIIGVYGYQGTTGVRSSGTVKLNKNKRVSLGRILNNTNNEVVFCNLRGVDIDEENSWMSEKIPTISWAFQTIYIVPNKSYDGIIQIRNIHATNY